ncbi:hypothetical protein SAMN06272775_6069 [Streptomyces sp. 2323.1]|nr:hypothetical protein SAMN06272775_6069 [Streptomyces sp. 2323.1]
MRRDYPHQGTSTGVMMGPTPQARGQRRGVSPGRREAGTNPACAGTTSAQVPSGASGGDQPRMRGDHPWVDWVVWVVWVLTGPTPYARGPRGKVFDVVGSAGTNPACAGTTTACCRPWDQPRMRGDHPVQYGAAFCSVGATPHARGPLGESDLLEFDPGTNPACARTTPTKTTRGRGWRDQPRMSGDHRQVRIGDEWYEGPTPHARGPPPGPHRRRVVRGTNPACAGTTTPSPRSSRAARDQPRMRGDHRPAGPTLRTRMGPTPRTTRPAPQRTQRPRDQPRMRGDR